MIGTASTAAASRSISFSSRQPGNMPSGVFPERLSSSMKRVRSRYDFGFFSLNLCQIKSETLPPAEAKRLPRDVGAVRLGRLAVDLDRQGQGLGKLLVMGAMQKFMEIFRTAGGIGLFVDAKDANAKQFYEKFGFIPIPPNDFELFLPVKTIESAVSESA
jgi:ribosomal protein S18 acetylase RimI-like enzyme